MIKDDHRVVLVLDRHDRNTGTGLGVFETKISSLDSQRFNGHLMDLISAGKAAAVLTHLTHTILITVLQGMQGLITQSLNLPG